MTKSASQELDLHGQTQSLTISGTGGSEVRRKSRRVQFFVSSINEDFSTTLDANVLDNIAGETPAMQWSELKEKWPYLKPIPFDKVSKRSQIVVLIGSDNPVVHRSYQQVHGPHYTADRLRVGLFRPNTVFQVTPQCSTPSHENIPLFN